MDYTIREIAEEEYSILEDFLYEAIFVPKEMSAPPKSIIKQSELQVYIADFGTKKDDIGLLAEVNDSVLKIRGYKQASLAVQKENYAVKMYLKCGFEIVDENEEEYIMLCRL